MLRNTLLASAMLLVAMTSADAAAPQPMCGDQKKIREELVEKYHEGPVAFGIISEKVLIEVYSSSKSWTILQVQSNGTACIVAAGSVWGQFPEAGKPGAES